MCARVWKWDWLCVAITEQQRQRHHLWPPPPSGARKQQYQRIFCQPAAALAANKRDRKRKSGREGGGERDNQDCHAASWLCSLSLSLSLSPFAHSVCVCGYIVVLPYVLLFPAMFGGGGRRVCAGGVKRELGTPWGKRGRFFRRRNTL